MNPAAALKPAVAMNPAAALKPAAALNPALNPAGLVQQDCPIGPRSVP
jgi:hypothetical protein